MTEQCHNKEFSSQEPPRSSQVEEGEREKELAGGWAWKGNIIPSSPSSSRFFSKHTRRLSTSTPISFRESLSLQIPIYPLANMRFWYLALAAAVGASAYAEVTKPLFSGKELADGLDIITEGLGDTTDMMSSLILGSDKGVAVSLVCRTETIRR